MYLSSSFSLIVILFTSLLFISISSLQTPKHYVVYMGSQIDADVHNSEAYYLQMLDTLLPREESERRKGVHHYKHAFRGFSAMLTEEEAATLSGHDEVVSVFEDTMLQLHTTRFHGSSDIIIGVVDTGIWPESPSFSDEGFGEIPSKWKGICMEGPDFNKSNCNRKLIGARYYKSTGATSARDSDGHGTHTASTVAGSHVDGASDRGLARGTAKGGQPGCRIAAYKTCTADGCSGSAMLKAIDDAVHDGVDIISISIGSSAAFQSDYLSDPIAIGAFHAERKGIMVIASAGNDGPSASTVTNVAPWLFTVAASNIDRDFQSSVILGSGKVIRGARIHFPNATRPKAYSLVYARNAAAASFKPVEDLRACLPGSLDPKKVSGKVIVCVMPREEVIPKQIIKAVVEDAGARGLILVNQKEKIRASDFGHFPFSEVDMTDGYKILKYMLHTKNPTVTIVTTVEVKPTKPAPVVALFSSRGPASLAENILKPDVMAPGVLILAALPPPKTAKPSTPEFGLRSGTSMSCPHVSGAAAFVKAHRPSWTPSMIKSALMTTAITYDNMRRPVTNTSGLTSTPHETGAGEIDPHRAINPGLVFETTTQDYLQFLCYYGYSQRTISKTLTKSTKFSCPKKTSHDLISNINYPSISIGNLRRGQRKLIERCVTNVGVERNVTYVAHIEAPEGLVVKVEPKRLVFGENVDKISFKVWFYGEKSASKRYHYGSLEWSDGYHSVRSVFSVNIN
ncbi:CO(2)-response secreted protease [Raphanus sativus]|nr:CO(2)-response secreted protease [Raphanus sativus]